MGLHGVLCFPFGGNGFLGVKGVLLCFLGKRFS